MIFPPLFREPPLPAGTIHFISLGCPKNLVDSEVLLGRLVLEDFAVCEKAEDADIIVVNTCGFLEASRQESIAVIREACEHKRKGEASGVVVAGCLAQRDKESLIQLLPEVDGFLGIMGEEKIAALCADLTAKVKSKRRKSPSKYQVERNDRKCQADVGRLRLTPRHTAYVKISEGCDNVCTFCIIPKIRGRHRSKPVEMVVQEVRELATDGAKEINLIAQDTTSYGKDLYESFELPRLLREVAAVPGVRWVRLMYAYPSFFTDEMIDALAATPNVLRYVDMPLQHISDPMLKAMKRNITKAETLDLLRRLRERVPGLVLRTTFIVGFPGETEEDFEEMLAFVKEAKFDRAGAFKYSPERGTPAGRFEGQLSDAVKEDRYDRLMRAQQAVAFEHQKKWLGKEIEVLVESHQGRRTVGRTAGDAPDIDGVIYLTGKDIPIGEIVTVRVTRAEGYDLHGRVIGAAVEA
ncbi:MAG: 30S ribosomal protein S12 methylthiotransferase RimO [Planctomycetes bacterium]|nr:30S ribosomal protein S12 methylthiotransferase RimO [Planctomycetota bacterium]